MSNRKRLASPANDTIGTYGHLRFSIIPAVAVYDVRLSSGDVRTLAALGSHATAEHGYWCWPEIPTLSHRLGVSDRRVQQSIATLEACGYVEVCERFDPDTGHQLANGYRLIMDYELPDEYRRNHHERPRKGIGGRRSSPGRANSEFTGEGEMGVHPAPELGVHPAPELGVHPSESEKKKQRKEAEKTRVRGASPSIAEKGVQGAESAERTPPTPPTPSPAPAPAVTDDELLKLSVVTTREIALALALSPGEAQWLERAKLYTLALDEATFILRVRSTAQADQMRRRYLDRIRTALFDMGCPPYGGIKVEVVR